MLEKIRSIRISLASKLATLTTLILAVVGLLVLAPLLILSASSPLTPEDIVWLMACCAALTVPLHYFIMTHITRSLISRPLAEITETARDLGSAPLPTIIPVEDELDTLVMALVRSGGALTEKIRAMDVQLVKCQELLHSLPGYVSVQNREFRITFCNNDFSETFNVSTGAVCPCSCTSTTPGVDCPVSRTFVDGVPRTALHTGAYPNGTATKWLIATAPIWGDDGSVQQVIEIRLDITGTA